MANTFVYDRKPAERKLLIRILRDAVAFYSEDSVDLSECDSLKAAVNKLYAVNGVDIAMLEVAEKEDISFSAEFRASQLSSDLLLIAEPTVSPMEYLTPAIRAASLLLRPLGKEVAVKVIKEFIAGFYRRAHCEGEDTIIIENRQGKTVIPANQIYYLEVRGKRVFIRLADKEYTQYDSLDNMLNKLPGYFIKCHRSFAFNRTYLQNVKLSENTIYLEHDITVPLSRSFKSEIKRLLDEYR